MRSLRRGVPALILFLVLALPALPSLPGSGAGRAAAQPAAGAADGAAAAPPRAAPRPQAAAPRPAAGSSLTPEDLDRLTAVLRDDAQRAELLRTLEALSAAARARSATPPGATASNGATASPGAGPARQPPAAELAPPPAPVADPAAATAEAQPPPRAAAAPEAPAPAAAAAQPAAPAPPAEPIIAPDTTGALVLQRLAGLKDRLGPVSQELLDATRTMADLPSLWRGLQGLATDPVARTRLLDAAWNLVLLVALGRLAEWLAGRSLGRARARLDAAAPREGESWTRLRRVPLVLGRLVLDLVPIAAFALVFLGVLELLQPLPTTRRIGLLGAHAYIAARVVFALARMLLSPRAKRLRLISTLSDRAAARGLRWLRRLLLVGLGGYLLAEAGIAFGLSWAAYDAIFNLTLLVLSLMLVHMVLRSRAGVAAALRAPPLEEGAAPDRGRAALRALRNGLAEIWHLATILWLLAAWVVWALAIEDGLSRLFLSTLLVVGVGLVMKGLDEGLRRLLDRVVGSGGQAAAGMARAVTWLPVLRAVLGAVVACLGLMLLFELWGLDSLAWFAAGTLGSRILGTLVSIGATFVAAALVWEAMNAAIARRLTRLARESGPAAARSARVRTLLPMLRTALGIVIIVFLTLSTLAELGVNVAPLLAGAGVVGLAIGFGSQTLVRDVITGVFLLLEDAVAVGDVVQLGGLSGVVEHLSIRSIKLRATDGSVHIIPFSAVTTVTNMTRDFAFAVLDVTVSYDADPDQIAEVLREISEQVRAEPKWAAMIRDDIDIWGVDKMSETGMTIRARVKTGPAQRWPVGREFNRRITQRCAELGIELMRPGQRVVLEQQAPVPAPEPPPAPAVAARAAE